ncbi:Hydantoinase B/oxoprolinase-domain-containing protein [Dipodascopsis tothii]|uniref:Hydantoinase B/oxoprolinase-domain-containing protein n=1 Tax=Dipodascopsis tothii TaxID=44089 RepID=UPI0034CD225A
MAQQPVTGGIRIAIDRGGTFTDCIGSCPGQPDVVIKLLSVDPANYEDAPREGIRRILERYTGRAIARTDKIDTALIESIRMGTTVATNALLERKGERCALVTTKGFRDCLVIGNQSRPKIFDIAIRRPDVLYDKVVEVDERVTLEDYTEDPARARTAAAGPDLVRGLSGETVRVLRRPDEAAVAATLAALRAEGFRSVAVCLLHSYTFPEHERLVGRLAAAAGFAHISLSCELMPMIKHVPRATSATADAYLTPEIKKYLAGFAAGFAGGLGSTAAAGGGARCEFMQSDGGLVDVSAFSGLRAILSGPAGGVVGYARTSYDAAAGVPVIGFDMGGTSTDVSRYGDGRYEHVFETTTAGVTIQSPQLDINTVAAGGGSRLFWKNGMFVVGPESAGAHPGPACYRKGGPLTVTDANLVLGRLVPEFFPRIFGPREDEGLDADAARAQFAALAATINADLPAAAAMTVDEVAYGFLKVANEAMTRPIRTLTEAKGFDTSTHRLATFGGAGGQHAVAIAESLGIAQIIVHKYSSVLSAYGMALADVVEEAQEPCALAYAAAAAGEFAARLAGLRARAAAGLRAQGFRDADMAFDDYLNMRYQGTESALMVVRPADGDFRAAFVAQHQHEFGFTLPDRDVVVDDVRVRAVGRSPAPAEPSVDAALAAAVPVDVPAARAHAVAAVYFDGGRVPTPVFRLASLAAGDRVPGPAILADGTQTIVVEPRSAALVLPAHVVISLGAGARKSATTAQVDPIALSIFGHRFMAIAEQMGRALQKTSVSTNVKERLDYSCALFDAGGGLVANAPHLPVHLGSMSTCVRMQAELWAGRLRRGDVVVSNHPQAGGTHLPDITVITPAFHGDRIVFYVASRAHHADIGGILPGSMPPSSRELFQEGAAIFSEKLVSAGAFDDARMTELLLHAPAAFPGCSGTRCLADNLSDLRAQVAANQKGIALIDQLIGEYGEDVVQFYMGAIQRNAELAVRGLLRTVAARVGGRRLEAVDHMDDGSPIALRVDIDPADGTATFDFTGTGPEVYGNINAPEAVTYSAIIYCLRCMVTDDIPLNQGCLKPVRVLIPPGSFLSPSEGAAVVGGNVLTSQRVTDVIFKAFGACAASQGDCNNLTFGIGGRVDGAAAPVRGWGYYETIAGGSGAGPTWDGTDGVHTHMTNTRITDAEIFERRYPVVLREFALRTGSGGRGQHRGGDGVVRDIEFRVPVQCSILSERRAYRPYGMAGGEPGQTGLNLWLRQKRGPDGAVHVHTVNLGSKNTAAMAAGDRIVINTPGGGAWGPADRAPAHEHTPDPRATWRGQGSVAAYAATQETN